MIAFFCQRCTVKLKVKTKFAGRTSRCPTCHHPLTVPSPGTAPTNLPREQIDGTPSSLAQLGGEGGITLAPTGSEGQAGPGTLGEVLKRRAGSGERFHIAGEIARGGMGVVLRAVDRDIRREVAVKFLLDQADGRKKQRFIEEAQITGQLEHPNIVPVHELGVDREKRLYFTMKMVKGLTLARVLEDLRKGMRPTERAWPLARLLTLFVNVCNALAYAHSRGVVHRDLKPANIMVGEYGQVYVMDWGLAKVLRGDEPAAPLATLVDGSAAGLAEGVAELSAAVPIQGREADFDLTQDGTVLGTPVYMPPEQAAGNIQAIDQRSDIYSLGAILYEMLTLQSPIEKEGGHLGVLIRVMQGEIIAPEVRAPQRAQAGKVPPELAAITLKAMARDKAERYPNVDALRADIERFQEGRGVSARKEGLAGALWKLVKRNRRVSVVALILLGVALWGAWINLQARYAADEADRRYRAQVRESAPLLVRAARLSVNELQLDDALAQLDMALTAQPDEAEGRWLRGQLYAVRRDFPQAQQELAIYRRLRPDDARAPKLIDLCARARSDDAPSLLALAEFFNEQRSYALAGPLMDAGASLLKSRQALLTVYQKRLEGAWPGLGSRLRLETDGRFHLNLFDCGEQVRDLTPLQGMALSYLNLHACRQIRDLRPLQGMRLVGLNLAHCVQVRDLGPLQGMPLISLDLSGCGLVRDLRPLQDMALTQLNLFTCGQVDDLTPLHGMPLDSLNLWGCAAVRDLTPLQGMPLTWLNMRDCKRVHDLSALRGLPLTSLVLADNPLSDLRPLKGMPLTYLEIFMTSVQDLTPLEGINLEVILLPKAPMPSKGLDVLRRMKSLKIIGFQSDQERYAPEVFWKKLEAGEFK